MRASSVLFAIGVVLVVVNQRMLKHDAQPELSPQRVQATASPTSMPTLDPLAGVVAGDGVVLCHVINPMPKGHSAHVDQAIIFATLEKAAVRARLLGVEVLHFTADFGDDLKAVRPSAFIPTASLERDAYGLFEVANRSGEFTPSIAPRRLPLLGDIIEALYAATARLMINGTEPCDEVVKEQGRRRRRRPRDIFLMYSNNDIAVQEDFYSTVAKKAAERDAFVINRVEVPDKKANGAPYTAADLLELYRLGKERPQLHHGYDMFIWRRELTDTLRLYTRSVFVGYPPVGLHLRDAMECAAGKKFAEFRGEKHTFHVGVKNGGWSVASEYEHLNRRASRFGVADFAFLLGGHTYPKDGLKVPYRRLMTACEAARAAAASAATSCKVRRELEGRSFLRWDIRGAKWPPTPMSFKDRVSLLRSRIINDH